MEKKKVNKKSLEYVRPELGEFNLKAFPGHTFKFKKITVDDEAWVQDTFGVTAWSIVAQKKAQLSDVCRLYFRFLDDESKKLFPPEEVEELDYETGETKKFLLNGPKKFMRSIDGGALAEVLMIGQAFIKTLLSCRPISDLPEEVKKSLQKTMKNLSEEERAAEATP